MFAFSCLCLCSGMIAKVQVTKQVLGSGEENTKTNETKSEHLFIFGDPLLVKT